MKAVHINDYTCGTGYPLLIMAGPCVIESEELTLEIAQYLKKITDRLGLQLVFKASFCKDNRTSIQSYRGVELSSAIKIFQRIKSEIKLPIVTDIHQPYHAEALKNVIDIIQIPAFLCRQTSLLLAAGLTGLPVHVKKSQMMSPNDMKYVIEKLKHVDCKQILLCERGTFFGYGNLVNDMTSILKMQQLGVPVIFDATHSVQNRHNSNQISGGNIEMIVPLAKAAVAIGVNGLFFEVHPTPQLALSDSASMLSLDNFEDLLQRLLLIRKVVDNENNN